MIYPCTCYVLACKHGKYYVGTTVCTLSYRIQQHRDGYGSIWTRRHPMKRVLHSFPVSNADCSRIENEVWTWAAERWGVNNVRGGDVVCGDDIVPDWLLSRIGYGDTSCRG